MSLDEDTRERIVSAIESHSVTLFMKGSREEPRCGFSATLVGILDSLIPDYQAIDVLAEPELRDGIKIFSSWPTIPQLYVGGEFIGGCEIVQELHRSGELHEKLGVEKVEEAAAPRIAISDAAAAMLRRVTAEQAPGHVLQLSIDARFRSALGVGPRAEDAIEVSANGLVIGMDPLSARRGEGARIGLVDTAEGPVLSIDNPNAPAGVNPLGVHELEERLEAGEPALAYGLGERREQAHRDLRPRRRHLRRLRSSIIADGVFEVRSTSGDTYLGGEDFDRKLVEHLLAGFESEHGIDLRSDNMALQRLKEAAERAKHELSSSEETDINLPFIAADDAGPKHLATTITREDLEGLVRDLVERLVEPCNVALESAGLSPQRDRRGDPGGRHDAHAGDPGQGRADLRQAAEQGRQPRRGRRRRRGDPGRRAHRRGGQRPAPRRDAAVARRRDPGRRRDQDHRAQHHDSDVEQPGLLDHGGRPDRGADPRGAGRARARQGQHDPGALRAGGDPGGAARRAPDRGQLRHRRRRRGQRLGAGPRHRQEAGDPVTGSSGLSEDEVDKLVQEAEENTEADRSGAS